MDSSKLLILVMIIGIVELILVLLFWYKHLRHNKNHPIYRIRHPYFWIISLCISPIFVSLRAVGVYLYIKDRTSFQVFIESQAFLLLLPGFTFVFARIYFLWYALKLQRYEQKSLIKRHLLTEEYMNNPKAVTNSTFNIGSFIEKTGMKAPFIYKHYKFFGRPSRIFVAFLSFMFIVWLLHVTMSIIESSQLWQNRIMRIVFGTVIFTTFFITIQLWCCSKNKNMLNSIIKPADDNNNNYTERFRDDFKFRFEMTFIVIVMVFMFLIIVIGNAGLIEIADYNEYVLSDTFKNTMALSTVLTLFGQTLYIIIQTLIPYKTLKKNIKAFRGDDNNNNNNDNKQSIHHHIVSLLDILSHKYGFFLFIDQLVQELSFENLSYLIEIYQFKYITNKMMKEYTEKSRFKSYFKKKKLHKNNSNTATASNPTLNSVNVACIIDEDKQKYSVELSPVDAPNIMESSQSYTEESDSIFDEWSGKVGSADIEYYSKVLSRMPWHGIPLTASITNADNFDKLTQAHNIYNKYIDRFAYYSVNISANTVYHIENQLKRLRLWREINQSKKCDERMNVEIQINNVDNGNDEDNLAMQMDLDDINNIKSEKEWNELLSKIFDVSLPDIFNNLEDSMTRFRYTKEFLSLVGSK